MYQSSALSHDGAHSRFPAPRKHLAAFAPALLHVLSAGHYTFYFQTIHDQETRSGIGIEDTIML